MIDERTLELINGAIDKVLSESDRVELNSILKHSREAREYNDSLKRLDDMLSALPEQEPSNDLHEKIIKSVALKVSAADVAPIENARRSRIFSFINYGLATAAGVLLAVGYYQFSGSDFGQMDVNQMIGTMSPNTTRSVAIDEFKINEASVQSHARLESRNGKLILDIVVNSDALTDVSVNLAGSNLQFEALAQLQSQLDSIQIEGQLIQVRSKGRQHFVVQLHRKDGEEFGNKDVVKLHFSRDGTLVQHGTLSPR